MTASCFGFLPTAIFRLRLERIF